MTDRIVPEPFDSGDDLKAVLLLGARALRGDFDLDASYRKSRIALDAAIAERRSVADTSGSDAA